jgi:hypothetical protein
MNWLLAWFFPRDRDGRRNGPSLLGSFAIGWVVAGVHFTLVRCVVAWLGPTTAFWAVGAFLLLLAVGLGFALHRPTVYDLVATEPCVKCGYDLGANLTTRCPECGTACVAHSARYVRRHRGGRGVPSTKGEMK